jgi:hypothetical protein
LPRTIKMWCCPPSRRLSGQWNSLQNEGACVSHVYSMLGACVMMTLALQHTETERRRKGISLLAPASIWPRRQRGMTITTKRRIGIDTDGMITGRGRHIADRERDYRKKKVRREDGRARSDLVFRVDSPSCAVQPRNGTVVRAHLGCAG